MKWKENTTASVRSVAQRCTAGRLRLLAVVCTARLRVSANTSKNLRYAKSAINHFWVVNKPALGHVQTLPEVVFHTPKLTNTIKHIAENYSKKN